MKRSEMIGLILEHILHNTELTFVSEECVYGLLDKMERAGMSPPDYDNSTYGWNEGFITPPEWEPEDEK